ncbi:hypothetical protein BRC81_01750 [Halobacteriales archaeon QS_1_68_20]|nr:MAG: hypothetical protein BRC81_01750 [Halobacteriales archaeon QS_1_68_20]
MVLAVNDAFEEVFGYPAEEIVGESLDDYIVPPDRQAEADDLNENVADGQLLEAEVRRMTADGIRTFMLRDAPIDSTDGVRGFAIYADITDRVERERELQRQNERLEEFASAVSHDLRSPLSVARGRLQLVKETGDEDSLEAIAEAHERMDALIDDLLTLARQGQVVGETMAVDLERIAHDAWGTADTYGADLAVDDPGTVEADPDRLVQLLTNLFRNAAEHAGEQPQVEVGAPADDDGFYVADDGPGIPADQREQVFERGYTTDHDGTGFGLAIVEEIAHAHGWEVRVVEGDAGGARFEITGVEMG